MSTDKVDVVVVAFNSAQHLAGAVSAVRAWPRAGRVIVVDNASTDDSRSVATSVSDVLVTSDRNQGYGAGQNLGAAHVETRFFLALNPDARVSAPGLDRGFEVLDQQDDVAMVQGLVRRARDGEAERTYGREPGLADLVAHRFRLRQRMGERSLKLAARIAGLRYFTERIPTQPVETPFLAAVAPLVRTAAFNEVDGFSPDYFLYAEDIDLCRRIRGRGWRLLSLPDLWATHEGGASSASDPHGRDAAWWRGHRRLVEQHWTGARRAAGLALTKGRG